MTDDLIQKACIAYNCVLLNQPEDERDQPAAMRAALAVVREAEGWRPIESAPKDGTVIDLWIEGQSDMVDFYAPTARFNRKTRMREGRAVEWRWLTAGPNEAKWRSVGGLGYPLSPDVTPTHWRPLPAPPEEAAA